MSDGQVSGDHNRRSLARIIALSYSSQIPVFHLLTCLELYEGVLGLPATLIPLNEQRQVVCQAQGSPRVVLGLSRYSVLFTATERLGSVKAGAVIRDSPVRSTSAGCVN